MKNTFSKSISVLLLMVAPSPLAQIHKYTNTQVQIHKYASANTQIQYKYKMGPKMMICTVARLSLPPADGGLASEQLLPTSNM